MSSAGGVSIARSRGENRFYNPPPLRKLQQQQQQAPPQPRVPKPAISRTPAEKRTDHEECATAPSSSSTSSISSNRNAAETNGIHGDASNLDRFIEHTTLSVPAQYLPRTSVRGWRTQEPDDAHPYFILGDLWESLKEWSAYGAGIPILLNGTDSVMQYYCPYLSGIQLYIDPSRTPPRQRGPGEESDLESSREASSDDGSESGSLRRAKPVVRGAWSKRATADSNVQVLNRLSLSNGSVTGSSSDESEISHPPGQLIFQYMEHELPYGREPLADKISVLASQFPALKTYRSCDLSPSSWISVAWYPIYRIPMGPTLQNLEACFLTYHRLSTPLPSKGVNGFPINSFSVRESRDVKASPKLQLPTFGLAFYKFKVQFWNHDGSFECQKARLYLQAADNWLQNLQIHHPDFGFFVSHNSYPKPMR